MRPILAGLSLAAILAAAPALAQMPAPPPVAAPAQAPASASASASAPAQPPAYLGTWYVGECNDIRGRLRIRSDHMVFYSYDDKSTFKATISGGNALPEGWVLHTDGGDYQVTLPAAEHLTLKPRAEAGAPAQSFVRCAIPQRAEEAFFLGDADRIDRLLDSGQALCRTQGLEACVNHFWMWADVNRDGDLSSAEMARAVRHFSKWAITEEADAEMMDLLAASQAANLAFGPLVASAILGSLDYDANGRISKAEFLADIPQDVLRQPNLLADAKTRLGDLLIRLGTAAPMAAAIFGQQSPNPAPVAPPDSAAPPKAKKNRPSAG